MCTLLGFFALSKAGWNMFSFIGFLHNTSKIKDSTLQNGAGHVATWNRGRE
jgi:hypothetical protein